ncbi:AAA-like domain protein [compost metagenome]
MVPSSFEKKKDSILFLGRDLGGQELWSTTSMVKTHMFVSGSTGSGKTEFLTNIMANVAAWGSGGVFIDGKGDLAFFSKVHALMTAAGREEDLLLVNFSPANTARHGRMSSHTINPFSILGAEELSLIMTGMLGRVHDPMWSGRAISLMNAIIYALVWLRERHGEPITIGKLRSHLVFRNLLRLRERLKKDSSTSPLVLGELDSYFDTLPGFQEEKGFKQGQTTLDQHGYLSMQWTRPVGMLATAYGHILDAEVPDVDIRDVVLNRRVLVILLPSLDRSTEDIKNIGALLVGMLKSMLGQALRSPVEGTWGEVVRRRITNSTYPFMMVMDEVGQYLTDGMGMMAQQARSLNVGLVFATQDFDSLHYANSKETEAILANTNVKVFMKAENPGAMQIRSVLSTFVDRRRFERQKIEDVLRSRTGLVTHKLMYEPREIDRRETFVEMRHDQAWVQRMYTLDETGLRHYENAEPDDLALMLRGFSAGDMMVTHGADVVVGRAGYVGLDERTGREHEIRLQRFVHVGSYGQKEIDRQQTVAETEKVLQSMKERLGQIANSTDDFNEYQTVTSPSRTVIDPRVVDNDNVKKVWSELLFYYLKDAFPEDVKVADCAYEARTFEVGSAHEEAVKVPTRKPPSTIRGTEPTELNVLQLFEEAA